MSPPGKGVSPPAIGDKIPFKKKLQDAKLEAGKKKTGGFQERPVVVLQICIGDVQHQAQVNLAQRAHFKYPVLLGRNFLRSRFLVDPGEKYMLEPLCALER